MATRPWVTPQEIRDYTDHSKVQTRSEEKLKVDIARAELRVINYTHTNFADEKKYPAIPEPVRLAVILLAEMYASASTEIEKSNYRSESFDEYSYTAADSATKQESIDLGTLLDEYVEEIECNNVNMKLRMI